MIVKTLKVIGIVLITITIFLFGYDQGKRVGSASSKQMFKAGALAAALVIGKDRAIPETEQELLERAELEFLEQGGEIK